MKCDTRNPKIHKTRREFLRSSGWAFTGLIFVPKLIRAQPLVNPMFFHGHPASGGGGGDTPFISSVSGGTQRNDFSGELGFGFTVGGTGITVTSLGRYVCATATASPTVYILDFGTGNVVVSAVVSLSGVSSGNFAWASCTATALSASTQYLCMSVETSGDGSQWLNEDCTIATTSAATVVGSYFKTGGPPGGPSISTSGVHSFVPTNFKYH